MLLRRFLPFLALLAAPAAQAQVFAISHQGSSTTPFMCAVTSAGGVRCWGDNTYGQLGDGTQTASVTGTDVVTSATDATPLRGVTALTAGDVHACALLNTGTVKCWGLNNTGQLGTGTTGTAQAPSTAPVDVRTDAATSAPLSGVVSVAAGQYHTCALLDTGGVRCWGYNNNGQLGDGSTTGRNAPVAVVGVGGSGTLSGIDEVDSFFEHTCARTSSGQVRCWGGGSAGRLGDGVSRNPGPVSTPVVVRTSESDASPLSGVAQVDVGYGHACARLIGGGAVCWGQNSKGHLGDGTTTTRFAPVPVVGVGGSGALSDVAELSAGFEATCAVLDTGGAVCWGSDNAGVIGDGGARVVGETRTTPVSVVAPGPGLAHPVGGAATVAGAFSLLEVGGNTACALYTGAPYCWGYNNKGQTGVGSNSTPFYTQPAAVQGTVVLPVELVSFTAVADGTSVRLAWTTASETNNAGFTVERRTAAGWSAATGVIAGRGTTGERTDYAVTVENVGVGRHAFRLRQVDLDGTGTLSPTVEVVVGADNGLTLVRLGNGSAMPSVRVKSAQGAQVEVIDVLGRRVHVAEVSGGSGDVALSGLSAGTYVVRARTARTSAVTTVVVR